MWFFLGYLGAHRFYGGKTLSAIVQLVLSLIGAALTFAGVGFVLLGVVGIWLFIDIFLLPGLIRNHNVALVSRLS